MRYPLILKKDQNGTIIAQAVDAPGALTVGLDEADACSQAVDALIQQLESLISRLPAAVKSPKGRRQVVEDLSLVAQGLIPHTSFLPKSIRGSA